MAYKAPTTWENSEAYASLAKKFQDAIDSGGSTDGIQTEASNLKAKGGYLSSGDGSTDMKSAGQTYRDYKTGNDLTPYTQGNSYGTVQANTIFDPNSSNFNAKIANSGGKINLMNESDYDSNGNYTGANSGLTYEQSQAQEQARYAAQSGDSLKTLIRGSGERSYSPSYSALQSVVQGSTTQDTSSLQSLAKITMPYKTPSYVAPTAQTAAPQVSTPQVVAQKAKDNSTQISDMYTQQLASSQAALKASIQQSMGTYQKTIKDAPGIYQPLRDQASYGGAKSMQNLQEMLANNGQQGGVNRTEQTQVNSNTENNINKLNQQQQSVTDSANQAIADLQAQGDIKGAELVAQNASERIRALIDESNRVENTNYNYSRDAVADNRYNSETDYNKGRDALADTRYTAETDYNKYKDSVANDRYDKETNYNQGRDALSDLRYNQETAYNQGRDAVSDYRYNQQYADQRGDVAYDRNYQNIQDAKNDTRYNNETAYNQGRDSMADIKWAEENNYRAEQDRINQTGQLSNGTYTQQGQLNNNNIKTGELQLRELTDPNSTTNQLARLGLDTAKLNYSVLPAQLKSEAQLIAQQLSKGAIDIKTAQIQLNYLPQQIQQEITQNNAQINATNRSNQGSSSSSAKADKASLVNASWAEFSKQTYNNNGENWLQQNASEIINTIGNTEYLKMLTQLKNLPVNSQKAYNDARQQHVTSYNQQPQ